VEQLPEYHLQKAIISIIFCMRQQGLEKNKINRKQAT